MSPVILTPPPVPPPSDPASTAPPTLTITYYRQLAAHFSEAIDEIAAIIPRMEEGVPSRFASSHLNVPLKFLSTCISAVEEVAELRVIRKLDVERALDTLQLIDAFRPIRDKVKGFMKDLENALNIRQSALAVEALDTYDLAKSLARDPASAALTAWVDNMQRDLGKRGPKKKPGEEPAPAVQPVRLSSMASSEKPNGWNG